MQSIRWIGFGISNALTHTMIHFFPSEGGVTAPYQANCVLRIFGQGINEKRVVLEGARLSHPDGVRIEDVFSELRSEQVGLYGIEVELVSVQSRVDLSPSSVIFELVSKGHSAKYWPAMVSDEGGRNRSEIDRIAREIKRSKSSQQQLTLGENAEAASAGASEQKPEKPKVLSAPLVNDAINTSSLILVNGTKEPFKPYVTLSDETLAGLEQGIAALSVNEKLFDEKAFERVTPWECSWGLLRTRVVHYSYSREDSPNALYLVMRDALTRRPVSVSAL